MATPVRTKPDYVYVASSWRCAMQPAVIHTLRAAGIPAYDFHSVTAGSRTPMTVRRGSTGSSCRCSPRSP
jgi:hypothetical protein